MVLLANLFMKINNEKPDVCLFLHRTVMVEGEECETDPKKYHFQQVIDVVIPQFLYLIFFLKLSFAL